MDNDYFADLKKIIDDLPIAEDKKKHILASRALYTPATYYTPENKLEMLMAPVYIALVEGIKKEYSDKGKGMPEEVKQYFTNIIENIFLLSDRFIKDGLDVGDITADLCGLYEGALIATVGELTTEDQ